MLRVLCIVAAISVASCLPTAPHHGERLLEFNETSREWVTQKQLDDILMRDSDCPGFMDITDHQHLGPAANFIQPALPTRPSLSSVVTPLVAALDGDRIIQGVSDLTAFKTRYYKTTQAVLAAEWLVAQYEALILKHNRQDDISVRFFPHAWAQSSFIVTVKGSGPRSEEVVVLGSHIDSINPSDLTGESAPGSDDDASGTSTVLEVFRTLIESGFKPDRTVQFQGYAAEEVGLRGSQDIVAAYVKEGVKVASMLQLDMTLYQAPGNNKLTLITDYTSATLTEFLRTLVDQYCSVGWQNSKCGYACSDHGSYTKGGFAAAFPFETLFPDHNPAIHTTKDVVRVLNKEHGLEYAKLALAYVVESAGTA